GAEGPEGGLGVGDEPAADDDVEFARADGRGSGDAGADEDVVGDDLLPALGEGEAVGPGAEEVLAAELAHAAPPSRGSMATGSAPSGETARRRTSRTARGARPPPSPRTMRSARTTARTVIASRPASVPDQERSKARSSSVPTARLAGESPEAESRDWRTSTSTRSSGASTKRAWGEPSP